MCGMSSDEESVCNDVGRGNVGGEEGGNIVMNVKEKKRKRKRIDGVYSRTARGRRQVAKPRTERRLGQRPGETRVSKVVGIALGVHRVRVRPRCIESM